MDSRSADQFDHPRSENYPRERSSQGGGIRYIDPPNKKSNDYFYYTDDSPYYKAKLSFHPAEQRRRNDQVQDNNPEPSEPRPLVIRAPPAGSQVPVPKPKANNNAVVYSFTNNLGQKQKVGVIYDADQAGPQVNNVFSSNKGLVNEGSPVAPRPFRNIPLTAPQDETSHQDLVSGKVHHVHHAEPARRPSHAVPPRKLPRQQVFPLGNPYGGPHFQARPKYFPVKDHPPIFKVRPQQLEGVFGPSLPPKPEPTRINFPENDPTYANYVVPRANRRNDHSEPVQYPRPPVPQPQQQVYQQQKYQQQQPLTEPVVYKTVRDMDYVRPSVILHVKDSGELFVPTKEILEPKFQPIPTVAPESRKEQFERQQSQIQTPKPKTQHANPFRNPIPQGLPLRPERQHQPRKVDLNQAESRIHHKLAPPTAIDDAGDISRSDDEGIILIDTHNQNARPVQRWEASFLDAYPLEQDQADTSRPQDLETLQSIRNGVAFTQDSKPRPSGGFSFPTSKPIAQFSRGTNVNSFQPKREINSNNQRQTFQRPPFRQQTTTTKVPIVIGIQYDDNYAKSVADTDHVDYDESTFEESIEPVEENHEPVTQDVKVYSKQELYQLCVREVPEYLKVQLCGHVLAKAARRNDEDIPVENQPQTLQGQFVERPSHDLFKGIPTQLPTQSKTRAPARIKVVKKKPTVISTRSRVKVYTPGDTTQSQQTTTVTTTIAPKTTTNTARTTRFTPPPRPTRPPRPFTTTSGENLTDEVEIASTDNPTISTTTHFPQDPLRRRTRPRPANDFFAGLAGFFRQTLVQNREKQKKLQERLDQRAQENLTTLGSINEAPNES